MKLGKQVEELRKRFHAKAAKGLAQLPAGASPALRELARKLCPEELKG